MEMRNANLVKEIQSLNEIICFAGLTFTWINDCNSHWSDKEMEKDGEKITFYSFLSVRMDFIKYSIFPLYLQCDSGLMCIQVSVSNGFTFLFLFSYFVVFFFPFNLSGSSSNSSHWEVHFTSNWTYSCFELNQVISFLYYLVYIFIVLWFKRFPLFFVYSSPFFFLFSSVFFYNSLNIIRNTLLTLSNISE